MSKKIGIFLMIVLVLWSVLLLDATKNRAPLQPTVHPSESTGAPREPSGQEVTQPQTTAPEAAATTPPEPSRVEVVLDGHSMDRTAETYLAWVGTTWDSQTADLAEAASRREVNPIAAFWLLESEGLYERSGEKPGLPERSLKEIPAQSAKQYPYTDEGAQQLLTDLLTLSGSMADGLEQAILGSDGAVDPGQVFWSEPDGCRYAYFARIDDRSTQILCFYLRGEEWISDVEFQLLDMTDRTEPERFKGQAAALAAAAELLLTGTCRAGGEETGAAYEVAGFSAEAERFFFTAEAEQGSLTNYRLRK